MLILETLTQITERFQSFMAFASANPVIGGIISLWGLGVVTFLLRNVPTSIFNFLKKQFTVKLTLTSGDKTFKNFCKWYSESEHAKKSRLIATFANLQSMGFGSQWILHKFRPIKMTTERIENVQEVRVQIELVTFGRSRKVFDSILEDVKEVGVKGPRISFWDGMWSTLDAKPARPEDTLFLPDEDKKKLFTAVDNFLKNEKFYTDRGLNYKFNILLYGPPGTGKSTVAMVLASKLKKNLSMLSLSGISDKSLALAYAELGPDDMILIEDVDAFEISNKRNTSSKKETARAQWRKSSDGSKYTRLESTRPGSMVESTTSGLLNVLDGVLSSPGTISILTTNHLEKIDPAIIRPGRMDLILEIGYARPAEITKIFKLYYPDFEIDARLKFKKNLPMSFVQEAIIGNMEEPEEALKLLLEKKRVRKRKS